jgi:hypothetical protein
MISSLCLNMRKSINHKRKSARRRRLTPIGSEALPPSQGIHRDNHFDSFLRQRFAGACTRLSQLQHAGDRARLTVRRVSLGGASSLPGFRAAKWCGDIDRISCDSPKPLSGGCTDEASPHTVIASAAKQSIARHKERMDCFVALLLAMTASAARGRIRLSNSPTVIASGAKQSILAAQRKIGLLRRVAPRNDGLSGAWQVCITHQQKLTSSFVSYSSSRRSKSQSPVAPKALRIESRL